MRMEMDALLQELRLISAVGLLLTVIGFFLVMVGQSVLWGIVLLVLGLIMASTYRVTAVMRLNYEMKQR
jgi:membrane-bound ClpP family serine protease